jgi:hypothetical protein
MRRFTPWASVIKLYYRILLRYINLGKNVHLTPVLLVLLYTCVVVFELAQNNIPGFSVKEQSKY